MENLGLSWCGNVVWLCKAWGVAVKGHSPSSGGVTETARAAPGWLGREISLTWQILLCLSLHTAKAYMKWRLF